MDIHKNARLTPHSRGALVRRVLVERQTPKAVATALGVCPKTVGKWVERFQAEGEAGLQDRSSRPRRLRCPTPRESVERIESLRRERRPASHIAKEVGVSPATVSRVLSRLGLNKLKALDPPAPVRRYERETPGELIHIDIKKLGRFETIGHRLTGVRSEQSRTRGAGWEFVHVCIDDASRIAFSHIKPDEKKRSAIGVDGLMHPDDHLAAEQSFRNILTGQTQSYQLERRYRRKDGTYFHALGAVSVHRARAGHELDIAIIQITDVTAQKEAERQSFALHERLKLAVETSGAGVWDVDFTDERYHWDARMHELYGLLPGEFSGRLADWEDMMHPGDVARVREEWRQTMTTSSHFSSEYRICRPSGEVRHIRALAQLVRDEDGAARRAVGTSWDVTDYKRLNEEMLEEKERLKITLASIGEAVICTDALANITFVNSTAATLTGWQAHAAIGKPLTDVLRLVEEATGDPAPHPVAQCFAHAPSQYRASGIFMLDLNGGVYDIQLSAAPVRRSDGEMIGSIVVFQDVTTDRAQRRKMTHSAHHDALTGLPNRAAFLAGLERVIEEARKNSTTHALCYIDLDRFKAVNDTGGHAAGDALLKEIAKIIALCCSKKDIPARLGGDEFGLILRNTDLAEARAIASRLVDAICEMEFRWESMIFRVGASIGIAAVSNGMSDSAVILHRADLACYSAKSSGRRCVHVFGADERDDCGSWDDGKNYSFGG